MAWQDKIIQELGKYGIEAHRSGFRNENVTIPPQGMIIAYIVIMKKKNKYEIYSCSILEQYPKHRLIHEASSIKSVMSFLRLHLDLCPNH
ncbi:MAG: hypothetical protein Q6363_007950 [Candidatus Njordarchaeota archaeon]